MIAPSDLELPNVAARLARSLPFVHQGAEGQRAAVAIILRPSGDGAEVLLIRRAEREGDPWSGHMAFPGGRRDPGDADPLATALRETLEEVGIDLARGGRLLGRLEDLDAVARARRTGLVIAPFVFAVDEELTALAVNAVEVAETVWAPLALLARGVGVATMKYERDGIPIDLPSWHVHGHVVWGLTLRMLQTLLDAITSPSASKSASGR